MEDITFDEERTYQHPLAPETQVPDKGFEGWFYKKFPGGYLFKKTILLGIAILLFGLTFFFIALARFNLQTEDLKFEDRTQITNSL